MRTNVSYTFWMNHLLISDMNCLPLFDDRHPTNFPIYRFWGSSVSILGI